MNVLIAAPIRNRGWILNQYLACINAIDYEKKNISIYFILNDCIDNSQEIIANWQNNNYSKYKRIEIEIINFNNPFDLGESGMGRTGQRRDLFTYTTLAKLRNKILDYARREEFDYIFSIDSDILVKPDILNKLLTTGKDIISALVNNGGKAWNFLHFQGDRSFVPDKLFEVKLTGACYLISSKVFKNKNIKYDNSFSSGEDESFCYKARQEGFNSYVLPDEQLHVMKRR